MKYPNCWCGEKIVDTVDGFPLGFLSCPVHYSYCQPGDAKHFTKNNHKKRNKKSK